MADRTGGEKQFLGSFVRTQTKYGTNSKPTKKHTNFIKHDISGSDTLIGIALKYGVTVEEIKRLNKLWTNDSLFLRQSLKIPVSDTSESQEDGHLSLHTSDSHMPNGHSSPQCVDLRGATVADSAHEPISEEKAAGLDFLNKYDKSMVELKSNITKMNENVNEFIQGATSISYENEKVSRNSCVSYSAQSKAPHAPPILVIRSPSKSQSLERIRSKHEDLFQL